MTTDVDLPTGWRWSTLGEACDLNPRRDKLNGLSPDTPVTFVPMPAVDADQGAITAPQMRELKTVAKGYTAFKQGDVIMAKITPCMENGKAAVVGDLENGLGFGSTEFHVLRPNGEAIAEYLYHFIRQQSFRRVAESRMTGSVGQRRVPGEFLHDAPIPLPPIEEQRRIAAKLGDVLGRVAVTRARLDRVPTILRRFRQSVLAAAVSGRLTEEWRTAAGQARDSWHVSSVEDLCNTIIDCPHATPKWTEAGEICLRTTNFTPGALDLSTVRYVSSKTYVDRTRRGEPQANDVLYSREGGILGIACVFPENLRACLGQRMMLLRARPDRLLPEFLMSVLNAPQINAVVRDLTTGSASPHLNVGDVRNFQIPVPPVPEQCEILKRLRPMERFAQAAGRRTAASRHHSDRFAESVLLRAFSGQL